MKLSNMAFDRKKQELEGKVAKTEAQKYAAEQQARQYEARIAELEARNSSLEVLLKAANEQKTAIIPLTKHALFLRGKIH